MKCWECKKQVNKASLCHYVWRNKYNGEPIGVITRFICEKCYPSLKFSATHHIEVKSSRGKAITSSTCKGEL